MVDVDNLSDAELRSKLMEFGFPVMPITGTTRKVMAKKLRMLLENKNKIHKDKDNRRSLGRYSSEDESDSDAKSAKKDKYKRQTMAAPAAPPKRRTTAVVRDDPSPPPVRKEVKTSTSTTRTMKILEASRDDFDTGSDSDEVAEKYNSASRSSRDSPESVRKTPSPGRLPSSFVSASSAADAASEKISQMRSRLSQYNSTYDKNYSYDNLMRDKEDTPFLSNFTKRLSQLSESPPSKLYDYKSDIIKENDVNGGASSTRTYLNSYRATRGRPSTSYDYKPTNQSLFKNNFVPFMVLVVACLFFIIVAIVYLGIRSDSSLEVTGKEDVNDYLKYESP